MVDEMSGSSDLRHESNVDGPARRTRSKSLISYQYKLEEASCNSQLLLALSIPSPNFMFREQLVRMSALI